ncbi:MAG: response regulator transcription factor [Nitrospiraceae bacterium]|nr:response regulator transcription factor [Nitrospiraceae bacterium]
MPDKKILVVEDEASIADIVRSYLVREGFSVSIAPDGTSALRMLKERFDLIILDLMLPDMDGEEICRTAREVTDAPIIMLTAKSTEDDRVTGLGLGADDYVVKPFSPRELVARIKAHLRRSDARAGSDRLSFNSSDLVINASSMEVFRQGALVPMTTTEFRLFLGLAEKPNMVFSRLQLVNIVQGYDFEGFERVVDAHIKNIRQKLGDNPRQPAYIQTVYGSGYKFIGTPDEAQG